jgi:hypothetical protein
VVYLTPVSGWKDEYDRDDSIVYLLDAELRIARCNPAWDQFAIANDGEQTVSSKVLGTYVLDVVPSVLKPFYRAAYGNVQRFGRDWWHVFECSSPTVSRTFQMRILDCGSGELLTINTLLRQVSLDAQPRGNVEDYAAMDGIITMCSHCRRVKNLRKSGAWDWIPQLLIRGRVLATFGPCDFCAAYHGQH